MVLRERRLGVRCRGRSWFCCGSWRWFCCGSWWVWVIEGWREVCWRGLFGLLVFLFLFDFFLEGFFLFFGQGDIEDFLFGSTFVFGAQKFLGDFGFFFVDNFFDIASDEFEVGEFWGHEGRFGQDRLIDSGEFFAFIEQFAKSVYWNFSDGNESFQKATTYTFSADGTFKVMLVALNPPCKSDTVYFDVKVTTVPSAIKNVVLADLNMRPNPSNDQAYITFNGMESNVGVMVLDAMGRVMI